MRPVALHLAGFTAFRSPTDIDFSGADLFALTGPTGSGKSSVIDAICFALYGSIPRLSGVAPVVSLGKPEARVRLVFEVEGESWTVSRLVVRSGDGASQRDVRLEGPGVALDGVREVDARIVQLLGLGFDHFTRTVVLPQGRFAAFLEDGPAAREKLLKQLLDLGVYEEMRKRGAGHASRLEGEIAVVDARCHDLLVDEGQVKETEHRLQRLLELQESVGEAAAAEEKAGMALAEATQLRDATVRDLDRLSAVVAPEGLEHLGVLLQDARREAETSRESLGVVEEAVAELTDRRAALGEMSALERAIEAHVRVGELEERVARGKEMVDGARERTQQAQAELAARSAKTEEAAARVRELETQHSAHALRSRLRDGDDCPVCRRAIPSVPPDEIPADLESARARLADAVAARDTGAEHLAELTADLARLEGHLEQRNEELARARESAAECPPLEAVRVTRDRMVAVDAELAAARSKLLEARTRYDRAGAARAEAEKAGTAAAERLDRARDAVAGLDPPAPSRTDPAADWRTFGEWCRTRRTALEARGRDVAEEIERRERELAEIRESIRAAAAAAGLHEIGDDAKVAVATATAMTAAALERQRADLGKRQELERRRVALDTDRVRYDETAKLLRSNRFQQWLLEEALVGLVDFANTELAKLAGGAYSLVVDGGEFEVIDHRNAEARRSVKTLSGGETFLVSLALALALAERVVATSAIGTARIESMFLDEGFGTLDAETLEVVAAVVQELGSRERMVGLVTHVRELADQIPIRFEVSRLPEGSTVSRIDT